MPSPVFTVELTQDLQYMLTSPALCLHAECRKQNKQQQCRYWINKVQGGRERCHNTLQAECSIWYTDDSAFGLVTRKGYKELCVLDVTHGQTDKERCSTVLVMLQNTDALQLITATIATICTGNSLWPIRASAEGTTFAMANLGARETLYKIFRECHGHFHVGVEPAHVLLIQDSISFAEEIGLTDKLSKAEKQKLLDAAMKAANKRDLLVTSGRASSSKR